MFSGVINLLLDAMDEASGEPIHSHKRLMKSVGKLLFFFAVVTKRPKSLIALPNSICVNLCDFEFIALYA
jgi:hypothetical protein